VSKRLAGFAAVDITEHKFEGFMCGNEEEICRVEIRGAWTSFGRTMCRQWWESVEHSQQQSTTGNSNFFLSLTGETNPSSAVMSWRSSHMATLSWLFDFADVAVERRQLHGGCG
jgi:hypothetical protein